MTKEKLCKKVSFTIKGEYRPSKINNIHQHLEELDRGTGVGRPKKGKGSYRRKEKYRDNYY